MSEKEILCKKISLYQFAILDLQLFLDTHPYDMKTHAKIKEYKELLKPLLKEYKEKYGPLIKEMDTKNHWSWLKGPWPWELEDNE